MVWKRSRTRDRRSASRIVNVENTARARAPRAHVLEGLLRTRAGSISRHGPATRVSHAVTPHVHCGQCVLLLARCARIDACIGPELGRTMQRNAARCSAMKRAETCGCRDWPSSNCNDCHRDRVPDHRAAGRGREGGTATSRAGTLHKLVVHARACSRVGVPSRGSISTCFRERSTMHPVGRSGVASVIHAHRTPRADTATVWRARSVTIASAGPRPRSGRGD